MTVTAEDLTRQATEFLASHDPASTEPLEFLRARFDAGLAWIHFPAGLGGQNAPRALQSVVDTVFTDAGAPDNNPRRIGIGLGMAAPTILAFGTPEQRERFLRPLWTGEEVWCQLFSEPGAGSDLAALGCRAVRDGDDWIVTGQKVWTSGAHESQWAILVTRTDPDVPKHQGMTYFLCDMTAPGVEVRPLRQITGEAEFNEVYMTDVRVPDSDRVGDVGDGWRVSMTTLMNERVTIGGAVAARESGPIGELMQVWRDLPEDRRDTVARDAVMKLWIEAEVLRLTNIRAGQNRKAGVAGPEGSVSKLAFAEVNKRIYSEAINLLGPDGVLIDHYDFIRPESANLTGGLDIRKMFLRARANSIEGGTSEILRNILGERILGLPGEPRTDKALPWKDVPR